MDVEWNANGHWLLTASRDHLVKMYDIRMMKEVRSFRGHKKEVTGERRPSLNLLASALAWHPHHEGVFASGGADGSLYYWSADVDTAPLGFIDRAHEQNVWALAWHPLGHVLASGSNDNSTKFWSRSKPGDTLDDFHNQALLATQSASGQTTGPFDGRSNRAQAHGIMNVPAPLPAAVRVAQARLPPQVANSEPTTGNSDALNSSSTSSASAIPGMGISDEVRTHLVKHGDSVTASVMRGGGIGDEEDNAVPRSSRYQQPVRKVHKQFEQTWNASIEPRASGAAPSTAQFEGAPLMAPKPKQSLLGPAPSQPTPVSQQQFGGQQLDPFLMRAPPTGPPDFVAGPFAPQSSPWSVGPPQQQQQPPSFFNVPPPFNTMDMDMRHRQPPPAFTLGPMVRLKFHTRFICSSRKPRAPVYCIATRTSTCASRGYRRR